MGKLTSGSGKGLRASPCKPVTKGSPNNNMNQSNGGHRIGSGTRTFSNKLGTKAGKS